MLLPHLRTLNALLERSKNNFNMLMVRRLQQTGGGDRLLEDDIGYGLMQLWLENLPDFFGHSMLIEIGNLDMVVPSMNSVPRLHPKIIFLNAQIIWKKDRSRYQVHLQRFKCWTLD